MAGTRGPVPKKESERRRRNKDAVKVEVVNVDDLLAGEVEIPLPPTKWVDELDEAGEKTGEQIEVDVWHPIAQNVYESVMRSGQVIWMEPSDWSVLYLMCESLSRDLKPQFVGIGEGEDAEPIYATIPLKGSSLNAYTKTMASLMMLEGDRRRLRIELERKRRLDAIGAEGSNVVDIAATRKELFG